MYAEMRRALVAGGRLAFFDVLDGRAPSRSISRCRGPATTASCPWRHRRSCARWSPAAGFAIRQMGRCDRCRPPTTSPQCFGQRACPSELGAQIVVPDMADRAAALLRNVAEGRVTFIQCVADAV